MLALARNSRSYGETLAFPLEARSGERLLRSEEAEGCSSDEAGEEEGLCSEESNVSESESDEEELL